MAIKLLSIGEGPNLVVLCIVGVYGMDRMVLYAWSFSSEPENSLEMPK